MSDEGLVYVAGHQGLVGGALVRRLRAEHGDRLLTMTRSELDLTEQDSVNDFFAQHRPSQVYLAAARVGGIKDNNDHPADFIRQNLLIQTHVIDAAWRHGARKLLFLGSSCIYPKMAPQPLKPEHLLSGPLEPTNQAYAIAKIAGIEMCRSYRRQYGFDAICAMPTNLYGPGDRFDPENSHVIPALIYKFAEAKRVGSDEVVIWGSGTPRREFLYVDDFVDACCVLMSQYSDESLVNIGYGGDVTIRDLAETLQRVCEFDGHLTFNREFPDGTPQKRLDVSLIESLGWKAKTDIESGLRETWKWYCQSRAIDR